RLWNGTLLNRPDRLPGHAIEHIKERLLARNGDGLDRLSVDVDVGEDWGGRNVVVPDGVMHELEVPLALTGLQVDAHEALREQVVVRPVGSVEIRRWPLERER